LLPEHRVEASSLGDGIWTVFGGPAFQLGETDRMLGKLLELVAVFTALHCR
jgi:hypothetical protein